jgi:hypothetical protein
MEETNQHAKYGQYSRLSTNSGRGPQLGDIFRQDGNGGTGLRTTAAG